ncbi:MAG: SPFH domain-containing protein [Thermoplasmata archaeon]|nr:SPFH domain-containing protein [Thermoplasmata archaeon]
MIVGHHSGAPSEHVVKYVRGKPAMEGRGLDFLYLPSITKIVSVPTHSLDASFAFEGRTSDFQPLRVEGEVVYRITAPRKAAAILDFTVRQKAKGRRNNHLAVLKRRVLGIARSMMVDELSGMTVRKALTASSELGRSVKIRMSHSRQLNDMGVSILGVHVMSVECPAHVAEAIEAENLKLSILTSQSSGNMLLTAHSDGQVEPRGGEGDGSSAPSIQCTDNCPFRGLCGDFMRNMRGGRAWCTLFHEFST